LVILQ